MTPYNNKRIAIVGGGPSALFMYKRLTEDGKADVDITIFERKSQLGSGMPYSTEGANKEHITNVSDNEIPPIVTTIHEWLDSAPKALLEKYSIDKENFNEYKVLPRLFFGEYLSDQFRLLKQHSDDRGIRTTILFNKEVIDVIDNKGSIYVEVAGGEKYTFDKVIICSGHNWPKNKEGRLPGYYDSPYPPAKLALKLNHPVALRGSSLTAIDAIRTLARNNGSFTKDVSGKAVYALNEESKGFKIVMHSRNGLLPAVRFHLEDSHLSNDSLLTSEDIKNNIQQNEGFLSLDYVFENDFKKIIREKDPEFYERIKAMKVEEFVDAMMELRERVEPFTLLRAEYAEAEKSIRRHQSVFWKEMLAVLSFAMNYPAKYFSAEDMLRLQRSLMPLISIVIAFVPQTSCEEMLALHDAGLLEIVSVGNDSEVVPEEIGGITYNYTSDDGAKHSVYYITFVDCIGQPHLSFEDFPFKSLAANKTISPAKLKFRDADIAKQELEGGNKKVEETTYGDYYLSVPGITINDNFQVADNYGAYNPDIYIMAVPYIGGYNPDYSGLDFSEEASGRISKSLFESL